MVACMRFSMVGGTVNAGRSARYDSHDYGSSLTLRGRGWHRDARLHRWQWQATGVYWKPVRHVAE